MAKTSAQSLEEAKNATQTKKYHPTRESYGRKHSAAEVSGEKKKETSPTTGKNSKKKNKVRAK